MKQLKKVFIKLLLKRKELLSHKNRLKLEEFNPKKTRKVLVISCTAIGDTLFSLPGIKALRSILPEATIDFLVRDKVYPLFKDFPVADNFLIYKGHYNGAFSLLKTIKKNNYQLCLAFHDSDPCPIELSYLAGIPFIFRIGYKDEETVRYLTARAPYDPKKHAIDQRLELLRQIFNMPLSSERDFRMDLPLKKERLEDICKEVFGSKFKDKHDPLIGFQFSASRYYKEWPMENFVSLGRRLVKENNTVVVIGGPKDKKRAQRLINGIQNKHRVIDLCGKIPLSTLPYVIGGLDVLVTNDTGPLHVAIAVKTKTVSLFVPTNVVTTGPIQDLDLHKTVVKPRPCSPCVDKYCKEPNCMSLIKVDEVLEAVNLLLTKSNKYESKRA